MQFILWILLWIYIGSCFYRYWLAKYTQTTDLNDAYFAKEKYWIYYILFNKRNR